MEPVVKSLNFIFIGTKRFQKPMSQNPDIVPDQDEIYMMRSLPGDLVAWGTSYADAVHRLKELLHASFHDVGGPLQWYTAARDRLSPECKQTILDAFLSPSSDQVVIAYSIKLTPTPRTQQVVL